MTLKEDIKEILFAIYKIPGEFFIAGLIAWAFWNSMRNLTNFAIIFLFLSIFLFMLEILTPFLAGWRIYKRIFEH